MPSRRNSGSPGIIPFKLPSGKRTGKHPHPERAPVLEFSVWRLHRVKMHTITQLNLATGNAHKVSEISSLLHLPVTGIDTGVAETGTSFEANALIKAEALAVQTGDWALADDSGLEVDALGGAPGVYSARYAGKHGDDAANNEKLLLDLRDSTDRSARFVCVLALCGPDGETHTFRGTCEGRIAESASGTSGFGYDPLFIPDGYEKSFAELGGDVKQSVSHRANALTLLKKELNR